MRFAHTAVNHSNASGTSASIEEMGSVFSWCGDMLERTLCQLTRHPPESTFMDIVIQESGIDNAFNPTIWASLNMGKAQHPIQDARLYWTQNDGASWIGPMLHPPQNNFHDVFLIGRCYQLIKDINLHCDCCLGSIQLSSVQVRVFLRYNLPNI